MIDILIPTFNRAEYLKKNILLIDNQIKKSHLEKKFQIIISDNNSSDQTQLILADLKKTLAIDLFIYQQNRNIGPERNILFVLSKASSKYVMYLGDDDYLPDGYLDFVLEKTIQEDINCIIPGYSELHKNGIMKPARTANFEVKKYPPGFSTVTEISNFGHQMSGLLLKRDALYESYEENKAQRNLYPFIFFLSLCILKGSSYYAPKYQVLVSQGNTKDWNYDDSGLLIDVFKSYKIAFPKEPIKSTLANFSFIKKQTWRLRIEKNPINAIKAFIHLTTSNDVNILTKLLLVFIYPYFYARKTISFIKNSISLEKNEV